MKGSTYDGSMSRPSIQWPVVLENVFGPPSQISYPTSSTPPTTTVFLTSLSFIWSSFSTVHFISDAIPDSENLLVVLTLSCSNSEANSSASSSPILSRIELKAVLVRGKQVLSGQGLSTSRQPAEAGRNKIRDTSRGLNTNLPEWVNKYAFLKSG